MGVILLVAVLGVAVVFAYGSYKDLELKKKETKLAKKKHIEKNKQNNQDQQITNSNNSSNNKDVKTTDDVNSTEENKQLNLEEKIAKADKDGDGLATTDEMTPELEELTRQGKF